MRFTLKWLAAILCSLLLQIGSSTAQETESIPVPPPTEGIEESDIEFENALEQLEMESGNSESEADEDLELGDLDTDDAELELQPIADAESSSEQSESAPLLILDSPDETHVEQSVRNEPTPAGEPPAAQSLELGDLEESEPPLQPIPDQTVGGRAQMIPATDPASTPIKSPVRVTSGSEPIVLPDMVTESQSAPPMKLDPIPQSQPSVIRPGVLYQQPGQFGSQSSNATVLPRATRRAPTVSRPNNYQPSYAPPRYTRQPYPQPTYPQQPVVSTRPVVQPSVQYRVPTELQPPLNVNQAQRFGVMQGIPPQTQRIIMQNFPGVTRVERTGPSTYRVTTESVRYAPIQIQATQSSARATMPTASPVYRTGPQQYMPGQPVRNVIRGAFR